MSRQTLNKHFYLAVWWRLRGGVWKKWPGIWREHSKLLKHDNVPTYRTLSVR